MNCLVSQQETTRFPLSSLQRREKQTPTFSSQTRDLGSAKHTQCASLDMGAGQAEQLKCIQEKYRIADEVSTKDFLFDHPYMMQVLIDVYDPLTESFGKTTGLRLSVHLDEAGARTLCVLAIWHGPLEQAMAALKQFDIWLHSNRSIPVDRPVFDFELV